MLMMSLLYFELFEDNTYLWNYFWTVVLGEPASVQ